MSTAVDALTDRARAARWRGPVERACHALVEWLLHLIVVALLLVGLHGIAAVLSGLAGPTFESLLDAGDAGLITGFLGYGVYAVLNAYGAEGVAAHDDVAKVNPHGRILSAVRLAVRPNATMTIATFHVRLTGHLVVYTVILLAAIFLWLFILAPLPMAITSIGLMLFCGVWSVAVFAPRGSVLKKLGWLGEHRAAAGSFVAAFAFLLVIEELLRRSS